MKINTSILIGLLFIIPSMISYLVASTNLESLIAIIVGIFFFITGLFETNNYRDQNTYFGFVTVIIAILLILTYKLFLNAFEGMNLLPAVCLTIISVILAFLAYDFTKEWKLFKRKVMTFNRLGLAFLLLLMPLIAFIQIMV
ncbi:MAG: hypothetical protein ACPK7O_05890 [Methanobacterium sp.]